MALLVPCFIFSAAQFAGLVSEGTDIVGPAKNTMSYYEANIKISIHCVVGMGLRCTDMLIERGTRVAVLQARSRIGRVLSSPHPMLYMGA